MEKENSIQLGKAIREFNVGITTIVECLRKNGFEVEAKPNAKLSGEMYNILTREFQKDIAIKKQADDILIGSRKVKEDEILPSPPVVTKTPEPVVVEKVVPPPAPEPEVVVPPTPPPAPVVEKPVAKEPEPEPVKEPVKEEPVKEVVPEPIVEPVKVVVKEPEPPVVVEEPVVLPQAEEPVETPPVEEPKDEFARPKMVGLNVIGKVDLEALKRPKKKKGPPAPPPSKKEDTPPPPAPKDEPLPVAEDDDDEEYEDDDDEVVAPAIDLADATPAVESDDVIRAEAPQLRGLKILGMVNLEAKKEKRKRKRKKGDKPDPTDTPAVVPGVVLTDGTIKAVPKDGAADDDDKKKKRRKRKKISSDTPVVGLDGVVKPAVVGPRRDDKRKPPLRAGATGTPGPGREEPRALSEREIEEKVRLTMLRVQGMGKKKKKFGTDRKSRDDRKETQRNTESDEETRLLEVTEYVSVSELAALMDVSVTDVITTCMNVGVFVSINQRLDAAVIDIVASEFGFEVKFVSAEDQLVKEDDEEEEDPAKLEPRAPIVTVMGHVDHGKTSLLDSIRKTNVASGEAGGITQHIGAYEVATKLGKITFLDTPGHEAFTAMRARGAKVTDIAVVVVAADDSIMPQTKEAISHAQAANVPIVFAINKIDKENAKPEKIKEELAGMNFLVEEWGGTYQSQDISAKKGLHVEDLLEKILIQAELLELKANPNRDAVGAVLEASLDKGRGFITKMLVQTGTLRIGDPMVAGPFSGKVKAMYNERGQRIKEAGPSTPVMVVGLNGAPQAGDKIKVMPSEQEARSLASKRAQLAREQEIRATKRITLKDIGRRLALGSFKQLNLIIKGDMDGSVEALSDSLLKQSTESVVVHIVHKAVGPVTESDVLLASASDAIIIGFNVRPSPNARKLAEQEGVEFKGYSVIYDAIDEIRSAIEGMLEPTKEEKILGMVEIREVYKISKVGTVAGCYVQDGKVTRNSLIRIVRNGIVVFPVKEGAVGEITSLKRFKDDMKEVKEGFECGITIKGFNDIEQGDIIEAYEIIEVKQKLESNRS